MIKINLLQQRKTRRRTTSDSGEQSLLIGFLVVLVAGALVYLLVDRDMASDIEKVKKTNKDLLVKNKAIEKKTKNFDKLKADFEAVKKQAAAIEELNSARATPAWFLHELSSILTRGHEPTITPAMKRRLEANENLRWQKSWDPKHVWLTSIEEEKGSFTLRGSAQSDGDVTQLAHRMQASMFFENVQPEGSVQVSDERSGISFYNFTITGKVRY